jgi:hypothetical protein
MSYGGRNTPAPIQKDAASPQAAAKKYNDGLQKKMKTSNANELIDLRISETCKAFASL